MTRGSSDEWHELKSENSTGKQKVKKNRNGKHKNRNGKQKKDR